MRKLTILLGGIVAISSSCSKENDNEIFYESNSTAIEVKESTAVIAASDDEVSMHIDSIITGKLDREVISTGVSTVFLNENASIKIGFEIVDLNLFNPNGIPEHLDTLAIRVLPTDVEILDNSTYGYPDALNKGTKIDSEGLWTNDDAVLATMGGGGNFYNKKSLYLPYRFTEGGKYYYGWIRLSCSQNNHILEIHDFGYNLKANEKIEAGQK